MRDLANSVNLTDDHLLAIGYVAVRWAELEATIKEMIWELSHMRHTSALIITAHVNERMLADMAKALVNMIVTGPEKQLSEEIVSHLNYVIQEVYPKRNDMVHSTFSHPGDGKEKTKITPMSARGKLKYGEPKLFSAGDIFAIADEIYYANEKMAGYVYTLQQLIPKWHHVKKS